MDAVVVVGSKVEVVTGAVVSDIAVVVTVLAVVTVVVVVTTNKIEIKYIIIRMHGHMVSIFQKKRKSNHSAIHCAEIHNTCLKHLRISMSKKSHPRNAMCTSTP